MKRISNGVYQDEHNQIWISIYSYRFKNRMPQQPYKATNEQGIKLESQIPLRWGVNEKLGGKVRLFKLTDLERLYSTVI